MNILSYISSLFSEKKCYGCKAIWHFFCPLCIKKMFIYKPYCYVCKKSSPNFKTHENCQHFFPIDQTIVLSRYSQPGVKRLLKHAKFYWKHNAYEDIILQNQKFFQKHILTKKAILLPVPMHFLRKWKRWYNQSEKIAKHLSEILDITVDNKALSRPKYSKQQSHLSRENRIKNLNGVFSLKKSINRDLSIYLVDDVISTGSTLIEITTLLQKNGYKKINAIVLASD